MVAEGRETVLIIEDDEALVQMYRDIFADTIFNVVIAKDLVEASGRIGNQAYYCIIIDLLLKDRSTEKLLMRVKTSPRHINFGTPVLLVSGQLDGPSVTSLAPFVEKIILKPFGAEYLLQVKLVAELTNIEKRRRENHLVLVVDDDAPLQKLSGMLPAEARWTRLAHMPFNILDSGL